MKNTRAVHLGNMLLTLETMNAANNANVWKELMSACVILRDLGICAHNFERDRRYEHLPSLAKEEEYSVAIVMDCTLLVSYSITNEEASRERALNGLARVTHTCTSFKSISLRASLPPSSYFFRSSGEPNTAYAWEISWNLMMASSLPWFLSGWYLHTGKKVEDKVDFIRIWRLNDIWFSKGRSPFAGKPSPAQCGWFDAVNLLTYLSCLCTKTFHDTAWDACSGLSWTIIRKSTCNILIHPHRVEKPNIILNYLAACDVVQNAILRYLGPSIHVCVIGVCLLNARQSCSPLVK